MDSFETVRARIVDTANDLAPNALSYAYRPDRAARRRLQTTARALGDLCQRAVTQPEWKAYITGLSLYIEASDEFAKLPASDEELIAQLAADALERGAAEFDKASGSRPVRD